MPRFLYLLRHAQSADKQTGQTDKERALTTVGWDEAKAVGFFFKEKSLIPELIITSSALRAKATSQTVAEVLDYRPEKIVIADDLYEATVSTFLEVLWQVDAHINSVLIVGHNPAIGYFADRMTNQQNSFHPAQVLGLRIDSNSWKDLKKENIDVVARFHPNV